MSGKGGRFALLGTGLRADSGMLSASEGMDVAGEMGFLLLAAVEGLRSCLGDG